MGSYCAVAECNHSRSKFQKMGLNISFHRFPRDNRRKDWILRCKRADKFNPNVSYICSAHFEEDDYEFDMRAKIMGGPKKRTLKKTALPHLNIPIVTKHLNKRQNQESSRSLCLKKKIEQQNHEEILTIALSSDASVEDINSSSEIVVENHSSNLNMNVVDNVPSINYRELYMNQKHENGELKQENKLLEEKLKQYSGINYESIKKFANLL